jgi:hypothetical protein
MLQCRFCQTGLTRFACNPAGLTTSGNSDIEGRFNLAQIFVERTAQMGKPDVIRGHKIDGQ